MKSIIRWSGLLAFWTSTTAFAAATCPKVLNHTLEPLTGGKAQSMCQYAGRVVLVVNTAGYTGQYEGLQALHKKFADRGLVVLGFPSNAFGGQEPGSNKKIAEFCQANFGVTFPVFAKVETIPLSKAPVFAGLVAATGAAPKWNFHKYLIDRSGKRVESFESGVEPQSALFVQRIEALIAQRP
jgi:glutathione peroxidase